MTEECARCNKPKIKGCINGNIFPSDAKCPLHKGKSTKEACEHCEGSGWLIEKPEPCRNMRARQLRQHLGDEIASAPHVTSSPLLELAGNEVVADHTTQNTLIVGLSWPDLVPHLKWVLGGLKGISFSFRIITDERIKNVFVGNENYSKMPLEQRKYGSSVNSLGDLVSSFDLVIIRLGHLGYKNQAAPGALKEAILIRDALRKPTWLVIEPEREWTHSCDADVAYFVDQTFEIVEFNEVGEGLGIVTDDYEEKEEGSPRALHHFMETSPTFEDESLDDDDIDLGPLGGG